MMEFDETKTAEENWDSIKDKLFKGGCPPHFDAKIKEGFKLAETKAAQHAILAHVLIELRKKVTGETTKEFLQKLEERSNG